MKWQEDSRAASFSLSVQRFFSLMTPLSSGRVLENVSSQRKMVGKSTTHQREIEIYFSLRHTMHNSIMLYFIINYTNSRTFPLSLPNDL